ncbi:MAG TPA: isochorismatase family protein [Kofleriaceae bacterium]|nr:isochorismatase family protein [Kofleriaceae bacterium]
MSALAGLSSQRAALLVIDIQERLAAVMPEEIVARCVRHTSILLEAARRMGLPVVLSEQYPKGLGSTVEALAPALAALAPDQLHRVEKLAFSAVATPELGALLPRLGRDQWIVVGMETHVCVLQTARDLLRRAVDVHVVVDAVASRSKHNFRVGIDQMRAMGAVISSMELVVFDLLRGAGTDDFKALSKLLR